MSKYTDIYTNLKYCIGLDLGIASVGWAVLKLDEKLIPEKIIDCGVRIFETAEVPKTGESLAVERRIARGARRRLSRRRTRIIELKKIFANVGVATDLIHLNEKEVSVWDLRVKALDEKLSISELARCILHIAKRRGFKSNRKVELEEKNADSKYKVFMNENKKLMELKNYRSIAEMIVKDDKFNGIPIEVIDKNGKISWHMNYKRNNEENYSSLVFRYELLDEMNLILDTQIKFGVSELNEEMKSKIIEIAFFQLPFASEDQIKKMVGNCELELKEKRASKNSFSFELFRFWQTLNNLEIIDLNAYRKQKVRDITDLEKIDIYNKATSKSKFTFNDIRKILNLDETQGFNLIGNYQIKKDNKNPDKIVSNLEIIKKCEEKEFTSFTGYNKIRNKIESVSKDFWTEISTNIKLLNDIANCLTFYKDDISLQKHLRSLKLEQKYIEKLIEINEFLKFGHLSITAINKILPFLKSGNQYDKAVELAGYKFQRLNNGKSKLPKIDSIKIANPVVTRSLSQARLIVNNITARYGKPMYVNIEIIRDLGKSREDRNRIKNVHKENYDENEKMKEEIKKEFGRTTKGQDLLKYKLWKEQKGYCLYTGKYINPDILFLAETQIDHIIPYSYSLDDGYSNKLLCFTKANQEKGQKTPFMWLGKDKAQWANFELNLQTYLNNRTSKSKLAKLKNSEVNWAQIIPEDFIERDLSDSRYVAKYFLNYLQDHMDFATAPEGRENMRRVYTYNGKLTAYLRRELGIFDPYTDSKNRSTHRHHAADAILVGVCNPKLLQDVVIFAQKIDNNQEANKPKFKDENFPWEHFRRDVVSRVYSEDIDKEENGKIKWNEGLYTKYHEELKAGLIHPLFISQTPMRKVSGQVHKDTFYSPIVRDFKDPKNNEIKKYIIKTVSVSSITIDNISDVVADRNTIEAIYNRLYASGGVSKIAFSRPIYKPMRNKQTGEFMSEDELHRYGNQIKNVKVKEISNSYVKLPDNRGLAMQGSMVRVDIFRKKSVKGKNIGNYENFVVPVYVSDIPKPKLPTMYTPLKNGNHIDESFEFLMSLYPRDYIKIFNSDGILKSEGYYRSSMSSGSNQISLCTHDDALSNLTTIGINSLIVEKYEISPLGEKNKVSLPETRIGFGKDNPARHRT